MIHILGGGLAGCEAAWQAARLDVPSVIHEMRPVRPTAVHQTEGLAELVCSNSFRGDTLENAVGLLKEEMRRLKSLIMSAAEVTRVPAGTALAVDRQRFSETVTRVIGESALITVVREEVPAIPKEGPTIIATGPLTSDSLSADIAQLAGQDHLYFYDAISPIVLAETIDCSKVFRASRRNRGRDRMTVDGAQDGEGDYLNCPLNEDEYRRFYEALTHAESATVHDFDRAPFFEGCLPIEVLADRGLDTLRFGPMKPVGLTDPRTGRMPHAVVQLRQDTLAGDHFSLVGFQTQLKWGEQARVLRLIPGLEQAEFVRFGLVHRNTYINAPMVLTPMWQTRVRPDLFFAGQISGVEGYVESAASGLMAGLNAAAIVLRRPLFVPPRLTAIGALGYYVAHADPHTYQPSNMTFGIMPPLDHGPRQRADRKRALSDRALKALEEWMEETGLKEGWKTDELLTIDK